MSQSSQLFAKAQAFIPGGVNSPVRAFSGVGGTPLFFDHAKGAYLFDADGKSYIDYVGSWGPMILGHAHPSVIAAVKSTAEKGLSFGAPSALEVELAELVCTLMPSIQQVRMVNSGTEACMSAIRLARGFTGRDKILKFEGCYHGHADSLLIKAGSGALTLGVPSSPGVPQNTVSNTLSAPFNDVEAVKELFKHEGNQIAAVIVEPIAGNMNCIPADKAFLEGLRLLCNQYGALLIFDEVMTGFRVALGGAQSLYKITPDLTTLGKVLGGGMPVGAFGGRKDIMQHLAPAGPVYQAGTLSGNPVAMAAGIATLNAVQASGFYHDLSTKTAALVKGLENCAKEASIPLFARSVGGMFGFFFSDKPIHRYDEVQALNLKRFQAFFHGMLDKGIYLAPSMYEAGFVSAAHTKENIEETLKAASTLFKQVC